MSWSTITGPATRAGCAVGVDDVGIFLLLDNGSLTIPFVRYDPLLDSYTTLASFTSGTQSDAARLLVHDPVTGVILCFGQSETWSYSIAGNAWSAKTAETMDTGRDFFAGGRNGRHVFIVGGYNSTAEADSSGTYDIDGDSWVAGPTLPFPLAEVQGVWVGSTFYFFGAFTDDGFVYAMTGRTYDGAAFASLTGVPYSTSVAGYPAVLLLDDGRLLIIGGSGDTVTADAWYYSPGGIWHPAPVAPFTGYKAGATYGSDAYVWNMNDNTQAAKFAPPAAGVTADVVALADIDSSIATLTDMVDWSWLDQFDDVGSGSVTLLNDDTALASIVMPNTLITFAVDEIPAFTVLVERNEATLVSENEESQEATILTGRGHLALFDRGIVYPALALGSVPIEEERGCNWQAAIYDWVGHGAIAATQICSVLDAQTGSWPVDWDSDFADTGADVLGPSSGDTTTAPTGACYYQQTVTVTTTGNYELQVLMDNFGEVFVDGALIMSPGQEDNSAGQGFLHTSKRWLQLSPGLHSIAARVFNAALPPTNTNDPTGWAFTLVALNADGTLGSVVGSSSVAGGALVIEYPAAPPGMTPGEAFLLFLGECQSGTLLGGGRAIGDALAFVNIVTCSFDAVNDSAGNPWPSTVEISTKVGTSLLTFLRELSATYIDFYMAPGTLVLDAWIKDGRGTTTTIDFHMPTDTDDASTGNLLQHKELSEA